MKPFDEVLCQAVRNKITLDSITVELKNLNKLEKTLISKRILFKKITIMHEKEEFSSIDGSISNRSIDAANTCNILLRPAVSNGLSVV